MLAFILLFDKKTIRLALTAAVFIAFTHAAPYAMENISSIHQEMFMSGNVYNNELDFIGQLPIDGRIITYGLFANIVDFGSNQLTGRYFSRDEREELAYFNRNLYVTKVHEANSFGDLNLLQPVSGVELSNYLRLGGYKYLFLNMCHPSGNMVVNKVYPNFSYPIYQDGCMAFMIINGSNYAEKVDLVENPTREDYKSDKGYKFVTLSRNYSYDLSEISFVDNPKEPEPLQVERLSSTKVKISGDFDDNGWVLFKERHLPRWKAVMNNIKVPIFADKYEQMLIKTIKGNEINLEYSVLPIEKFFGTLSAIAFLSFGILIIFLLKED